MEKPFDPNTPENKEQFKKRILVVDDDQFIRNFAPLALGKLYEVVTINDGKELLDKLNSGEAFDAVLTDQNMLIMNGIDAIEEIRKDPKFDKLPITLWSSLVDSEIKSRVAKLNNTKYIFKEGRLDVIKKAIEDMLEKTTE